MSENKLLTLLGITFMVFAFGSIAISSFAPDPTAQRISACMTQPNMMYNNFKGCIPINIDKENSNGQ
jgi:hypothetical protein